jgi:hypothetical protein
MSNASESIEADGQAVQALVGFAMKSLQDDRGRIRAEDCLCFLSTILAERCIDAAGDYDLRDHELTPGSRAFSDNINRLLTGDIGDDLAKVPAQSVFGMLRDGLRGTYELADFPQLPAVIQYFAQNIGKESDWGKVPLSVPESHHPSILPLQVGYETRDSIDDLFRGLGADKTKAVRICTAALADLLGRIRGALDPKIALALTFESVHGMAKTAPMTARAMSSLEGSG